MNLFSATQQSSPYTNMQQTFFKLFIVLLIQSTMNIPYKVFISSTEYESLFYQKKSYLYYKQISLIRSSYHVRILQQICTAISMFFHCF